MKEACSLIWTVLIGLFRTRSSLVAEILILRHQINVLRRHSPKRQTFSSADRLIFAWPYGLAPTVLNALAIVKPETKYLGHVVVFGEQHLHHILLSYMKYHNEVRTHLSLEKDAPVSRAVEPAGHILCRPVLGGLHHQYGRV
jgi:hypothetical protein